MITDYTRMRTNSFYLDIITSLRVGIRASKNMRLSTLLLSLLVTLLFFCFSATKAKAEELRMMGEPAESLVVLELFTSQGCYSCPPAEKFLRESLATRADLLALELHVDYWDDLVYGSAGSWKDPFSSPGNTRRQVKYSKVVPHAATYTPQMIVHGREQTSGGNGPSIKHIISKVQQTGDYAAIKFRFGFKQSEQLDTSSTWYVEVLDGKYSQDYDIFYVEFIPSATTEVLRGENKGKTLHSTNTLLELSRLASSSNQTNVYRVPNLANEYNQCAIFAQLPGHGKIIGAARCPN